MASWEPNQDGVREICQLLHEYLQPGVDQQAIFMQLQKCSQYPDFNNYLTYILTHADQGQAVEVRQSAGLLLKNNLKSGYSSIPPPFQHYIKGQLLPLIGSPDRHLRSVVGTVISVLVQHSGPASWPELWAGLAQCLESGAVEAMEGALDSLFKICEEDPLQMDVEVPGLPQKPVDAFLPRLIALFASPHAPLRKLAVGTVNQFVLPMPPALQVNLDAYLQGLFALATDTAGDVRKLVCAGLVSLLEVQPDALVPHMRSVIEYMLAASQDADAEVALEACEFWSAFCEAHLPVDQLREFLPRLMGVLLGNMEYADDDEAVLSIEEDEETVPDREEDIKPFFHHSKVQGAADGGEEPEEDEDIVNVWNLRKCSAAGLDTLSTTFGDELLPVLMPLVQARLGSASEDKWKEREAGVLAMGAIAEGCITGLLPHLSQMVLFLLPMLEDKQPLVRSITCWTLSRYSRWVVKAAQESGEAAQLEGIMMGLLQRILDTNKRVQEAACSSFATLEEEAGEELGARLEPILKHLMFALQKYHRKNLRILYDAIGTLADVVGGDLAEPALLEIMMPPLVAKWQQLADSDKDILPLLECLTSISQALGPAFAPYAEPVFDRCLSLIRQQAVAKADAAAAGKNYDKEFVVCSLDLLSGLAEGLGTSIESLVGRTDLRELLLACCADDAPDVRQSAFALLGDLAKSCVVHLKPRLADFLNLATAQLQQDVLTSENISGANNACWAVGELSIKAREDVVPFVLPVVGCLVPILKHEGGAFNKSMIENSAITLGRLGWIAPEQVAPHMEHFVAHWCKALRSIRDDIEKEHAFQGLCAMVKLNPSGALPSFKPMCEAIASWHEIHSAELRQQLAQILAGFKQLLGENWAHYWATLEAPLQQKLMLKYNL